jgi:hypothetical protein
LSDEGYVVAIVEVYFTDERSVVLAFSPSGAADFVHFVVTAPVERHGVALAGPCERSGDTAELELATSVAGKRM